MQPTLVCRSVKSHALGTTLSRLRLKSHAFASTIFFQYSFHRVQTSWDVYDTFCDSS